MPDLITATGHLTREGWLTAMMGFMLGVVAVIDPRVPGMLVAMLAVTVIGVGLFGGLR